MWEYKNQPREIVIFAYIKLSKVINFITHLVPGNHAIIKAAHQVRNTLHLLVAVKKCTNTREILIQTKSDSYCCVYYTSV